MRFNFFNRAGNKEQNFRTDEPETSPWDSLSEIEFAGGGLTGPSTESTEEIEAADFETSVASGMEDSETNSGSFENAEQDEQGRQTLEAFKHFLRPMSRSRKRLRILRRMQPIFTMNQAVCVILIGLPENFRTSSRIFRL